MVHHQGFALCCCLALAVGSALSAVAPRLAVRTVRAPLLVRRPPTPRAAPRAAGPLTRLRRAGFETSLGDDDDDVAVPDAVLRAVEQASGGSGGAGARVTEADVAVSAGLSVDEARAGLLALARQTAGDLDVSPSGVIVYRFAPGVRGALRSASARARRRETWLVWRPRLARVARLGFGAALFASLAIVFTAVTVLSASAQSQSSEDNRRGRTVYVSHSFISPLDLWYYSRPRPYYARSGAAEARAHEMSFVEACFSFVFGDGDPDAALAERRWQLVGALIREQGGAITAEQLAPLLAPDRAPAPDGTADGGGASVDESFVLPALVKFDGMPTLVSDEAGSTRIVYTFPELAPTAGARAGGAGGAGGARGALLTESAVPFSNAAPEQLLGAGALGAANLVGVLYLGKLLRVVQAAGGASALAGNTATLYALVAAAYPLLVGYSLLFVGTPLVRNVLRARTNAARAERNGLRAAWANALAARTPQLLRKLRAARAVAPSPRRIGGQGARGASEIAQPVQETAADDSLDSFDQRLRRRTERGN